MANKVLAQGITLWYAPDATAWTEVAAGAAPASPWVQITDVDDVDVVPFEAEEHDTSSLEDTAPELDEYHKPGHATFTKSVNDESVTLDGFAKNKTKKAFAVVYRNGTARYNPSCRFIPTSGGKGQKGDFKAFAQESYKVRCVSGKLELQNADT